MVAYECPDQGGTCGGGFGGGGPMGYAWAVSGVPYFEPYIGGVRELEAEPTIALGQPSLPVAGVAQLQTMQPTSNQQPQAAGSEQQAVSSGQSKNMIVVPVLIVLAALAFRS